MNVNDLQRALGLPVTECLIEGNGGDGEFGTPTRDMRRPRRPSMENMDLLKVVFCEKGEDILALFHVQFWTLVCSR